MSKVSRIRIELSRSLSYAEKEYVKDLQRRQTYLFMNGALGRVRLSDSGRLYFESWHFDSRTLYTHARMWIEEKFVNVFPTAVRTFRELGK